MLICSIAPVEKGTGCRMLVNPVTAYSRIEYKGVSIENL